ncbi:hypothetical protein L581_4142 [Serratia fonticola AU-AP2C]|nr:hypothetical protein L581_4142 [Serratia fonticola AU-AP2C]
MHRRLNYLNLILFDFIPDGQKTVYTLQSNVERYSLSHIRVNHLD